MARGIYYVSEKDLWEDVAELYETDTMPERLAANVLKMAKRIVGAKRWDSCSDFVREEMVSRASSHACRKLMERKYNQKKGSKVYSWLSRVIINECLKEIEEEQRRSKAFQAFAEHYALFNNVERITNYDDN